MWHGSKGNICKALKLRLGRFHVMQLNRKPMSGIKAEQNYYWITSSTVTASLYAIHSLQIYQLTHSWLQISKWANCAESFQFGSTENAFSFIARSNAGGEGSRFLSLPSYHVQHTDGDILIEMHHASCNPVRDPDAETTPGLWSLGNGDQVRCGHEQLCHWGQERGLCQLFCSNNIASQPIYSAILTAMEDKLFGCPTWGTQLATNEGEEDQRNSRGNGNHNT